MPGWVPHQLFVLVVAILITYLAQLNERIGLTIVKDLPSDLPIPTFHDMTTIGSTAANVAVIAVIAFLQSYSIAAKAVPGLDANREMWASGCVNFMCGIFGGFPVATSMSLSAVLCDRQCSTPIPSLVSGLIMLFSITVLTRLGVFYYLPNNVLAAIICGAMTKLINLREPFRLWKVNKMECLVWSVTFLLTLFLGITIGVLTGMGLSLVLVILRVARPHTASIGFSPHTGAYTELSEDPELLVYPRVLMWRFDGPLYFVNMGYFEEQLGAAVEAEARPIDVIVVNCSRVTDIDAAGLSYLPVTLRNVYAADPTHRRFIVLAQLHGRVEPLIRSCSFDIIIDGSRQHDENECCALSRTMDDAVRYANTRVSAAVLSDGLAPAVGYAAAAFVADAIVHDVRDASALRQTGVRKSIFAPECEEDVALMNSYRMQKDEGHSLYDAATKEMVGVIGVFRHADRTPKQKMKVRIHSSLIPKSFASWPAGEKKQIATASVVKLLLDELRTAELNGTIDNEACRLVSTASSDLAGLTLQLKKEGRDFAVLVCKWGGTLTDSGRKQAMQLGKSLLARFFAAGDVPLQKIQQFMKYPHVRSGSDERVASTAVVVMQAMTDDENFSARQIVIDDELLTHIPSAATEALEHAAQNLSRVLHARTAAVAQFYFHIPCFRDFLELPVAFEGNLNSSSAEGTVGSFVSPFAAMCELRRLMLAAAGGLHVVEQLVADEGRRGDDDDSSPFAPSAASSSRSGWQRLVLYEQEPFESLRHRWAVLTAAFAPRGETGEQPFDVSTIPKIVDYAAYDSLHNLSIIELFVETEQRSDGALETTREFAESAFVVVAALRKIDRMASMLSVVCAALYAGSSSSERFVTGTLLSGPLCHRIVNDVAELAAADAARMKLGAMNSPRESVYEDVPSATPLTRCYFTQQSHLNALRNCLVECPVNRQFHQIAERSMLGYMTHLLFKVYRCRRTEGTPQGVAASREGSTPAELFDYFTEVYLSTGARASAGTEETMLMPMTRIHHGLSQSDITRISNEVHRTSALLNQQVTTGLKNWLTATRRTASEQAVSQRVAGIK